MSNAGVHAEYLREQGDCGKTEYENRRTNRQYPHDIDPRIRKICSIREKYRIYRTRCTEQKYSHGSTEPIHEKGEDTGEHPGDQIKHEKLIAPESSFEHGPEKEESEHIKQNMRNAAVYEHVGDELPDIPAIHHEHRIHREINVHAPLCNIGKKKDEHVYRYENQRYIVKRVRQRSFNDRSVHSGITYGDTWRGSMRNQSDHYTRRAQREGYPARSVYKLEEIQNRYGILSPGMRILDVGASPGSFSMFILKRIGDRGRLVAIDMKKSGPKISDSRYRFVQADITDASVPELISDDAPFDCIVSDAAPSTTGNRTVDTARSAGIAEAVIELARHMLGSGGNLAVKVFQGSDHQRLLKQLRVEYREAKQFKPKASRKDSFEVFLIGIDKREDRPDPE